MTQTYIADRDGDEILTEDEFSSLQTEGDGEKEGEVLTQGEAERRKEFRDVLDQNHDGKADRKELLVRRSNNRREILSVDFLHRYIICCWNAHVVCTPTYSRHMRSTFECLQDHTIFYVMLIKRSIFQFALVGTVSPIEDSKGTDVRLHVLLLFSVFCIYFL